MFSQLHWFSKGRLCRALHIISIALPLTFLTTSPSFADSYSTLPLVVSWDTPTTNEDGSCLSGTGCSNDLMGYRVYRAEGMNGSLPGTPTVLAFVPANQNSYIDTAVATGGRYRYYVTSIDLSGNESGHTYQFDSIAISPTADDDRDGVPNGLDNCPLAPNSDQSDTSGDGRGDACRNANPGIGNGSGGDGSLDDSDTDIDGVNDAHDNCPRLWNPDQTDSNHDGIGDACTRTSVRANCSRDSDGETSSVALVSNGQAYLVDPNTLATTSTALLGEGAAVVGDFDGFDNGPDQFGALELAEAKKDASGAMTWEISTASRVDAISFGAKGEQAIGCYLDRDVNLDLVSIGKKSITTRTSSNGLTHTISLRSFRKVLGVACGDLNGDGIDEFVVLAPDKKKSHQAATVSVSVIDSTSGRVKSKSKVDRRSTHVVLADISGNGVRKICTAAAVSSKRSAIACLKAGKKKVLTNRIKEISAGRYDTTSRAEGFVILDTSNMLSLVSAKGSARSLRQAQAQLKVGKTSKAQHLAPCR